MKNRQKFDVYEFGTTSAPWAAVPGRHHTHIVLALTSCLSSSCGDEGQPLVWSLRFQPTELSLHARIITGEVRAGGCSGPVMFSTSIHGDGLGGSEPEPFAPGRYGFHARAEDAQCGVLAEGCEEVDLPRREAIDVVLTATSANAKSCRDRLLDAGRPAQASSDAGAGFVVVGEFPSTTARTPLTADASAKSDPSLGSGPTVASQPLAAPTSSRDFDPTAAKCQTRDDALVACFDFESSLDDRSGRRNDPTQVNVGFELGVSGNALRVEGKRVAIPDALSLDVGAFTIEAWIRSDGLANLSNEVDDRSVLVDKDKQYTLGYDTRGELRMEVHNAVATFELIGSDPNAFVVPSVWTYVACTFDGSVASLYKDGVRIESRATGLSVSRGNGSPLHIGSGSPGTTRTFHGLFDALRISSVARSESAICAAAGKQLIEGRCR